MDVRKDEVVSHPVLKEIADRHRGVVKPRDVTAAPHPAYTVPMGVKKTHGWCPHRVRY